MWNNHRNTNTRFREDAGEHAGGFARAMTICALTTGMFLATAAYALAAPESSNTLTGVDAAPGINWNTRQSPPDGAGAAHGPTLWRPWLQNAEHPSLRRRIFNAEHPSARRRIFNAEHPSARRRIFNARQPARPHRPRVMRRR